MKIKITKQTGIELMRAACNKTFRGNSKQTLLSMYKSEHSPCRTQMFWIDMENVPLFVSTHLLRHHVGSQPYALTMRTDRGAVSFGDALDEIVGDLEDSVDSETDKLDYHDRSRIIDEIWDLEDRFDRKTPTNLGLFLNAQALIDMAKLRLCKQASKETIQVFDEIKKEMFNVDPALAEMMVAKCVYRNGLCGEPRRCGYNKTKAFESELKEYVKNF